MKYLFTLLCCMVAILPLHAEEKKAKEEFKGAHIRFEKSECDFGDIERKGEDKMLEQIVLYYEAGLL